MRDTSQEDTAHKMRQSATRPWPLARLVNACVTVGLKYYF